MTLLTALLVLASPARAGEVEELLSSISAVQSLLTEPAEAWLSAKVLAEALAGERPRGMYTRQGETVAWGVAVFDIPVADLWGALIDKPHHGERMALLENRILEGTPRSTDWTIFQAVSMPMVDDRWWVTHAWSNGPLYTKSGGQGWQSSFRDRHSDTAFMAGLDPDLAALGVPLAWLHGSWLLWELGPERTLVVYTVSSAPGGDIPNGMLSPFASSSVAKLMDQTATMAREHIPSCDGRFLRPDGAPLRSPR